MGRSYYIFKNGELRRKDNSLVLTTSEGKRYIPIEDVDNIYVFGEIGFNSKLVNFLSQHQVVVHFFNYYGFYSGTFYPRERLNSGMLLIRQVEHYLNPTKRVLLAKEFLKSSAHNMLHNLKYYNARGRNLKDSINRIELLYKKFDEFDDIPALMAVEGNIREEYYSCFPAIFTTEVEFTKRTYRPPDNMVNTLISFINSLIYTAVLSEIYKTQLSPLISYLHEPGVRRYSLSLDIAEIFKPLLGDRLLFTLINKQQITEENFTSDPGFICLKEKAQRLIVEEFEKRLAVTVKHRTLRRKVSYRTLIRLELYKLIKHLLGEKTYRGFKIWW